MNKAIKDALIGAVSVLGQQHESHYFMNGRCASLALGLADAYLTLCNDMQITPDDVGIYICMRNVWHRDEIKEDDSLSGYIEDGGKPHDIIFSHAICCFKDYQNKHITLDVDIEGEDAINRYEDNWEGCLDEYDYEGDLASTSEIETNTLWLSDYASLEALKSKLADILSTYHHNEGPCWNEDEQNAVALHLVRHANRMLLSDTPNDELMDAMSNQAHTPSLAH